MTLSLLAREIELLVTMLIHGQAAENRSRAVTPQRYSPGWIVLLVQFHWGRAPVLPHIVKTLGRGDVLQCDERLEKPGADALVDHLDAGQHILWVSVCLCGVLQQAMPASQELIDIDNRVESIDYLKCITALIYFF